MVVGLSLAMRAAGLGLQQLQQQRGHVRCLVGRSRTRQQGVLRMASSQADRPRFFARKFQTLASVDTALAAALRRHL